MNIIQIKLTVQFNELIAVMAKLKGVSVEKFIIEELIMSFERSHDYTDQVRELAYPEEVVQV